MPWEPAFAVFRVAFVIATMVLVIGMMYLREGPGGVRRQAPLIALLAVGLLVAIFASPLLGSALGFGYGLLLLVLVWTLLVARILMRRREAPAEAERRREMMRRPAVRALFAAWFAFVIIATALLLIATTRFGS